jgi:hypothetical protein
MLTAKEVLISKHLIRSVKDSCNAYRRDWLSILSLFSKLHLLQLALKSAQVVGDENDVQFVRAASATILFEELKFSDVEACYYNFINFSDSESVIIYFQALSDVSK